MQQKVVFAIPDMGAGGAERVISILANEFSTKGIKVTILMLFGSRVHYQLPECVDIKELNLLKYPYPLRIKKLRITLKEIRGKGCLTIYSLQDSVLKHILAARLFTKRVRIISAERNNPYRHGTSLLARIKHSLLYLLADHSVFQTSDAKAYYVLLPNSKCSVIPNPITPTDYEWNPERLSANRLISVCRLHEQKNIPMTLNVIKKLKDNYPDIHLDIYGDGNLKPQILNSIRDMELGSYIELKGTTQQVTKVLSEGSIFISTSNFEGISNSMLEAMSVGMPIVCTDCPIGGAKMMLADNAGMLSPVQDVESFVQNVAYCLGNPAFAETIAKNARRKSTDYSSSSIANKWEQLMKQ